MFYQLELELLFPCKSLWCFLVKHFSLCLERQRRSGPAVTVEQLHQGET